MPKVLGLRGHVMDRSKYVALLIKIALTRNVSIPLSEKEIVGNEHMLDLCIDDLLASELSEYGFDETDELNTNGAELEDAIDYFNRFRLGS